MNPTIHTTLRGFLFLLLPMIFIIGALAQAEQETVSGTDIRIIDGDTIEIDGRRIRLNGIDAPEKNQQCRTVDGNFWPCGKIASDVLKGMLESDAQGVECIVKNQDRFGRDLGTCTIGKQQVDIQKALIISGLAVAEYADTYIADEKRAEAENRGIWAGAFIRPRDWRRGERLS